MSLCLPFFMSPGVHWPLPSKMGNGSRAPQTVLSEAWQSSELSTAKQQLDSQGKALPWHSTFPTYSIQISPLLTTKELPFSCPGVAEIPMMENVNLWPARCYSCRDHFLLKPGEILPCRVKDLVTSSRGGNVQSAVLQSSCYFIPLKRT